jgi:hypothetical protein
MLAPKRCSCFTCIGHTQLVGSVQWGDVATWVGGIATSAALFFTYGLLRITRREQRTAQAEKREAQARLVSAWMSQIHQETSSSKYSVTVILQNSSDEPVYGLRAAVGAEWSGADIEYVEFDLDYIVPPKSRQQKEIVLQFTRAGAYAARSSLPIELLFSDSAGKRWHRDRYGSLILLAGKVPSSGIKYFFRPTANTGLPG